MMRKTAVLASAALLALAVADAPAYAGTATANFTATAQVNPQCTISSTGTLNFNVYNPFAAGATTASTPLTVQCTAGTGGNTTFISLSSSANFGTATGYASSRAMTAATTPSTPLAYDLYQPSNNTSTSVATTTLWGDGTNAAGNSYVLSPAGSVSSSFKNALTINVFGSIPAGQDVQNGTYTDAVVATINF